MKTFIAGFVAMVLLAGVSIVVFEASNITVAKRVGNPAVHLSKHG